jgi:hypothetical protein
VRTIKVAVANEKSSVEMTTRATSENTIMIAGGGDRIERYKRDGIFQTELVPTDTIDSIAAENGISHPDFIKIDIEGAEPLLLDGLLKLLPKDIFCEISNLSPREGYVALLRGLGEVGYECYSQDGSPFVDIDEAEKFLLEAISTELTGTDFRGSNLWFLRAEEPEAALSPS